MLESVLAGLWAGYGLAVPVGAVAVLMVEVTARTSFRVGVFAALGAATADAFYAVAALAGGAALATAIEPYAGPLRWIGFLVLAGMAVRILLSARRTSAGPAATAGPRAAGPTPPRSYLMFLGLTALNPWPALYFVALILGRQAQQGAGGAEAVAYLVAVVAASASWQVFLACCGTVFGRFLTGPRGRRVTAVVSGALILGLAAGMVTGG
ncbi:LysE type translocator [Streptomyces sp. YIM 130001]|uniref:LysE family transporter n=1 Tax=Streptomyces sp. YIM 130001 TaxID=2259644 RepID=UPI000E655EA4|nr:LysE family transporter [Streptomyces sp. YIM 130001]RII20213.1 LysE type translocator [Streptomyces sp. YIM 130001]